MSNAFLQHLQFLWRNYCQLVHIGLMVLRASYSFQKVVVTDHKQGCQQTHNVHFCICMWVCH